MSVTLITNYYSDICDSYNYGRKFLELPEAIIDAVDDYFEGQTVDLNGSGNPDNRYINHFTRKKDADKEAKEMEVRLDSQLDYQMKPNMSLVELFDAWLSVEILPQPLQKQTIKKYEKRKRKIEEFFGDTKVSDILRSQYQTFMNWYGQSYEINELGRMNANIRKALEFAKADKLLVDDRFLLNVKLNTQKFPKKPEYKFLKSRADYDAVIDYFMTFMDYRYSVVDFVIIFCLSVVFDQQKLFV